MKPKGVSWPCGDEEDALWLVNEQSGLQLPASFRYLPTGSFPLRGIVRHPGKAGGRETVALFLLQTLAFSPCRWMPGYS